MINYEEPFTGGLLVGNFDALATHLDNLSIGTGRLEMPLTTEQCDPVAVDHIPRGYLHRSFQREELEECLSDRVVAC